MESVPNFQELGATFLSLGDFIIGHPKKARHRLKKYVERSVVGSGVAAVKDAFMGDENKAKKYLKGIGRATGKAFTRGGLMRDVSVFHQLPVCGESLGDVIGRGDKQFAKKRREKYLQGSVIGARIGTLPAKIDGNNTEAERLDKGCGKAALRFGVTAAGVAAIAATGGLAAPYGIAASAAAGATVGGGTGTASTALVQAIDKGEVDDVGAVVGNALFGGVIGGISKGIAAKKAPSTVSSTSSSEAEFYPQHPNKPEGPKSFSFPWGGIAIRNREFPETWSPKTPGRKADVKAAWEAGLREIEKDTQSINSKRRPGTIAIVQDKNGNAFGTSSVRQKNRSVLKGTLGSKQTRILKSIREGDRGVGHGNCAEQVAVNNIRYIRQKTNNQMFGKGSRIKIQAFGPARANKRLYNIPKTPCGSCKPVLDEFGILYGPAKRTRVSID